MKKKLIAILCVVLAVGCLSGCERRNSAELEQQKKTDEIMQEANDSIGMPNIKNFFEKKMLKKIYELRDNSDLITYTYTTNIMTGKKVFIGKSLGYGLPMSVQYSSPEKSVRYFSGAEFHQVPQCEPNGLYMPEGLSSTWIILLNEDGTENIYYEESPITVTQDKLPRRVCDELTLPKNYDDL